MAPEEVGGETKSERIRVLIVEDHAVVRAGIRLLLGCYEDVAVVGEAGDAVEALARARELAPDVALLDVGLPGASGIEVARQLHRLSPQIRLLMLTMHEDEGYFFEAVHAGASGYVLKEAPPEELLSALRTVYRGGIAFHPVLARRLLDDYLQRVRAGDERGSYHRLTDQEAEVLRLTAEGHSAREVGDLLHLSRKAVECHRMNLMQKLNLDNRAELVRYAVRKGLVGPHQ